MSAKEIVFRRLNKNINHIPLYFNDVVVHQILQQNYLGVILDQSLSFEDHVKTVASKVCKTIVFFCLKVNNTA